ncbi:ER degradation-enhancing alpha-mannosidase-like protein 2 [Mytilus californianus]|uniref:ER degradation-enhancing alpha-mannosidase-like protein 2 n=1 Tax=Mytilus californianus TaxID=6549 RepID=UPI002246A0F1|nr:ER degradation-enhancing alpha-mannosidase-like protein 2 [Mytilus californianus]
MAAPMKSQYVAVIAVFVALFGLAGSHLGKAYSKDDILKYREKVEKMFHHAYDGYIKYAYPYDELRPLTCDGHDTWGSYSLTLIDALDTLAIMGNYTEFRRVAKLVSNMINFDIDINASVFETNIRILGGLLSAHLLYKKTGMELEPGWPCSGPLLRLAEDVARRILPAFDTQTGMPYGTVNLRHGVPKGETTVTCTAGVGTFLIEFGTLSRLTGDPVFEKVAMRALRALWNTRSPIGMVGNHVDVKTGKWTAVDFGIGGGIDSYFEYLVKGGIMFNIPELVDMFHEYHAAVKKYLKRDDWYMWANMNKGGITLPMFTSLDAYWPGILSMLGENDQAMKTLHNFHQVWKQYGFTPEYYNIPKNEAHKGREGYPLRPELIESVMYLYRATKDPFLLDIGVDIIEAIEQSTKTKCGYATVKDVNNHLLENRMESFFLAETTKYLYLLFDPDNFIHNNGSSGTVIQTPNGECVIDAGGYFFNTEAHPMDSAAVYCCSAAKKEDDAILQEMHDNLDLLSLLDILDSTETIIGEKLILKQKKEEKSQKLKGETGTIDEYGKLVEKNENIVENKNIENEKIEDGKDESIYMKNDNEKKENGEERNVNDEKFSKSENNMDVKKDGLDNKKESLDRVTLDNVRSTNSSIQVNIDLKNPELTKSEKLESKHSRSESTDNQSKNSNTAIKELTILPKQVKQTSQTNLNSLVQLLSLLSGKEITADKKDTEWIPDVNHLYQVMQMYSNIYKVKPELMMCNAQPFHMRWSVNGEMFEED